MSRSSTATSTTDRQLKLPEDAKLLGYNRDVGFFRSEREGLVFIIQGDVIWVLPSLAGKEQGSLG